jgi:uncharacterized cupredoxin-like copper-binding protein
MKLDARKFLTSLVAMLAAAVHAHGDESHAGRPATAAMVDRTIVVTMNDTMRFDPASITVKQGETIRFTVRNQGRIRHEMMLGTAEEVGEHAQMMRAMPDMVHHDANAVTLDAGKDGELLWQFTHKGTFTFACLEPGHFEAGMHGTVVVK